MRRKTNEANDTRSRLRTALQAVACITVFGLLAAVAAAGATAQDVDSIEDAPIQGDPPRVFTPAAAGSEGPPLPFPGLSPEQAAAARADLAARDRQAATAALAADRAYAALGDPTADPIPVDLPPTEFVPYEAAPHSDVVIPRLAASADSATTTAGGQTAASACTGTGDNLCYQSDILDLSHPAVGLYASQYWVWLGIPQSNEENQCDSTSEPSGCFWFYAMQHDMDSGAYSDSALHVGPQRGSSIAGDTGNQWRMNIDGYIDGVHIGGQSSVNLPTETWIRVRIWRLSHGYTSPTNKPWSRWGVWAMWGGSDRQLGSLTIDGHLFAKSALFSEIMEENGQCSTDLNKGYLDNPRFWNTSVSEGVYSSATAEYEDNCDDTTWKQISGDHVLNQRETQRLIEEDDIVWQY